MYTFPDDLWYSWQKVKFIEYYTKYDIIRYPFVPTDNQLTLCIIQPA